MVECSCVRNRNGCFCCLLLPLPELVFPLTAMLFSSVCMLVCATVIMPVLEDVVLVLVFEWWTVLIGLPLLSPPVVTS